MYLQQAPTHTARKDTKKKTAKNTPAPPRQRTNLTNLEEPHRHVEGGAPPALQAVRLAESDGGGRGDVEEVRRAHSRGEQRLVRVPPGGVGDEGPLVAADRLGERRRAVLQKKKSQDDLIRKRIGDKEEKGKERKRKERKGVFFIVVVPVP